MSSQRLPCARSVTKAIAMSGMQWFWGTVFAVPYLVFIFTVGLMTFRKGHVVLGILGIFVPLLWLIRAVLPDRGGGMTPELWYSIKDSQWQTRKMKTRTDDLDETGPIDYLVVQLRATR